MSMICPSCGGDTRIICTAVSEEGDAVARRRVCQDCGETVFTLEMEAVSYADVVTCRTVLADKVYKCREKKND